MESIETLNERLIEHFGRDSDSNQPMFRIVWAPEQTEKRLVFTSEEGVQYLFPQVEEVRKYRYMKDLYVLEQLVLVDNEEMPGIKKSYEPLWAYCTNNREPVIPMWNATKLVIDTMFAVKGDASLRHYVDDSENPEEKEKRIKAIREELFGNETSVGDALAYQSGVTVPHTYGDDDASR